MTYIKGIMLILTLGAVVLLIEILYSQRQELKNADLYVEQNIEKFAQSGVDGFDNMQNNLDNAVDEAEKTYSQEFGL